jgi:hypothetical protein
MFVYITLSNVYCFSIAMPNLAIAMPNLAIAMPKMAHYPLRKKTSNGNGIEP